MHILFKYTFSHLIFVYIEIFVVYVITALYFMIITCHLWFLKLFMSPLFSISFQFCYSLEIRVNYFMPIKIFLYWDHYFMWLFIAQGILFCMAHGIFYYIARVYYCRTHSASQICHTTSVLVLNERLFSFLRSSATPTQAYSSASRWANRTYTAKN